MFVSNKQNTSKLKSKAESCPLPSTFVLRHRADSKPSCKSHRPQSPFKIATFPDDKLYPFSKPHPKRKSLTAMPRSTRILVLN